MPKERSNGFCRHKEKHINLLPLDTILLVEDDPGDALLFEEMLQQQGCSTQILRAERLEEAVRLLQQATVQIVLLDLNLPDSTGLSTLSRVLEAAPHLPVILLTGLSDEAVGIAAVKAGAQDYLLKDRVNGYLLGKSVRYAVERKKIDNEKSTLNQRLQETYDSLLASEARLRRAQQVARLGYWQYDHSTGRLDCSDEVFSIFGIDSSAFDGSYNPFLRMIHPDDMQLVVNSCVLSIAERRPCSITHRLRLPDDRVKFVHEQSETVFTASGVPVRSTGTVQDITEFKTLQDELDKVTVREQEQNSFHSIISRNPAIKALLQLAEQVAQSPRTTVAIYGESGTGKELLARAIHFAGNGLPGNFVAINCAALPEQLLESELFGHERGAFTGADRRRDGRFSAAAGGTLLLDEIGDMPLPLQAKLLRVLEARTFERLGSNISQPVNCRVIAATNKDLSRLVVAGRFREDLFHRINIFPLCLPPLRERREDIPLVADAMLKNLQQQLGRQLRGISVAAQEALQAYHWPGNLRELRNCLERAAILCNGSLIGPEHLALGNRSPLPVPASDTGADSITLSLSLPAEEFSFENLSRQILHAALERCNGNKSHAAKMLKISRTSFYRE